MAAEPDVIRQQIDDTRESLTEKLDTLEGQVKNAVGTVTDTIETVKNTVENTVASVKCGVEETVQSVKSSLGDTVDSVKETFDLQRQVDRHPWTAVGCSLAAGVAAGYLLAGQRQSHMHYPNGIPGMEHLIPGYQPAHPAAAHPEAAQPSALASILGPVAGELGLVKKTVIGALLGIVRDGLRDSLPPAFSEQVNQVMDNVTRAAGGEPIRGPILRREEPRTDDPRSGNC
jgi:ElaB/YqjD/DUF883 family membrane-anchored ribosome-binding protein